MPGTLTKTRAGTDQESGGAERTLSVTSDEILVARTRAGDRRAREELFHRHWGIAYRVAHRLLGHEQDTLDAVQEAFLKAVIHLGEFDGRSGFRTWLLRIVTNTALDAGRHRSRSLLRRSLSLSGSGSNPNTGSGVDVPGRSIEPSCDADPAAGLHRDDLRRQIDAALDRLSPPLRAAFVLFAEAGLSYKEIAAIQEIPLGTVMSRISAARQKLQTAIELEKIEGFSPNSPRHKAGPSE